jgi:hypothetical protein
MSILRTTPDRLATSERADLEAALRDPERFHSDGKEIGQACVILPLLLAPLWFVLLQELLHPYRWAGNALEAFKEALRDVHFGVSMLWQGEFLILAGVVLLPLVIAWLILYGVRTRGRHGYAITSFGVVRIRGRALRVLRYEDLVELKHGRRDRPQYRVITDELELVAKDGKRLTLYGFGLLARKAKIEELWRNAKRA